MILLFLAAAVSSKPDQLRCVSTLHKIEIVIPANIDKRIGSLAVVNHGKWVALVDGGHHFAAFGPGVRRLVLVPARQMGIYAGDDGKERRVKAFAGRGSYRIVFADNLETEPENMALLDCLVTVR